MHKGRGLIIDVGMHDGSDTDFYLAKGFDVIGIEANPDLIQAAISRFANYLEAGQLRLIHAAVADSTGETPFYVSAQDSGWSSLDPAMATHGIPNAISKTVMVPSAPLPALLAGAGDIHYMKIDIEGSDFACIKSIPKLAIAPSYVSFEADLTHGGSNLSAALDCLEEVGYARFKLVNQATVQRTKPPHPPREGKYVDASFGRHSSGLFGEESPGPWATREIIEQRCWTIMRQQSARIAYQASGRFMGLPLARLHRPLATAYNSRPIEAVRRLHARSRGQEMGGWFDIHAALGAKPASAS